MTTTIAETQETINTWATVTFGETTVQRAVLRVAEEGLELWGAALGTDPDKVAEECADVYICACRLASLLEVDTAAELELRAVTEVSDLLSAAVLTYNLVGQLAIALQVLGDRSASIRRARLAQLLGGLIAQVRDICVKLGHDLQTVTNAKMARNRARVWQLDGQGCGYHVSTTSSEL